VVAESLTQANALWHIRANIAVAQAVEGLNVKHDISMPISAEHAVDSLKVEKLEHYKSPVALQMMGAVKLALDRHRLMNPGRVVRV